MKIVIACDSFKGTFTSVEVGNIVSRVAKDVFCDAMIKVVSVADGGEGTTDSVYLAKGGERIVVSVRDPLGSLVAAEYIIVDNNVAVMEMASASGLHLVEGKKDIFNASTYGVGEMIKDSLDRGCKKIIIGLGGSATNDGGAGMAMALGVKFFDDRNERVNVVGEINNIARVDISELDERIENCEVVALSDVTNPLCGENGASVVFGPQKGATSEDVKLLDNNLGRYANVIEETFGKEIKNLEGAGAAGGLGAGLIAFCNARIEKGAKYILDVLDFEEDIKDADLVITGEGRVDFQTVNGKLPITVANACGKYNIPVFAICGYAGDGWEKVLDAGIDGVISSVVAPAPIEKILENSEENIYKASRNLFRIIEKMKK